MESYLVDSPFFLRPEPDEDAPGDLRGASRSRAIDIFTWKGSRSLDVSNNPIHVDSAHRIRELVHQPAIQANVCSPPAEGLRRNLWS